MASSRRDDRLHPIVHLDYRIRTVASVFEGLAIGSALWGQGLGSLVWALLVAHALAWPHVALLNARLGRNTKNAELTNLLIDAALGGVWIAAVHFNPWPTAMIVTALVIAFLSVAGIRFTLIALAVQGAAIAGAGVVFGFEFRGTASPLTIATSAGGLLFYATVFGLATNRQARRIIQTNKTIESQKAALSESLEHLTATSDIARAISQSPTSARAVLDAIAAQVARLCDTVDANVLVVEGDRMRRIAAFGTFPRREAATTEGIPIGRTTVSGRAILERRAIHVTDIGAESDTEYGDSKQYQAAATVGTMLAVPLLREGVPLGALLLRRSDVRPFSDRQVELVKTFADQAAIAIDNARLFEELQARTRELGQSLADVEDKSRQVEAANRAKSQFLANMSHELRTPLNAIIGFSEVLAEGMFGETNAKQAEYLRDILDSGRHLLSLINDVLDLSKVEAGRIELELTDFDLPGAIDNAVSLVRERAGRRGIALGRDIDSRLGPLRADERKVKQVLLNLLSNALKFTPEGGRVHVRAGVNDEMAEISVADSGVGIAAEDQDAVFEEFRQVGTADKKVEGTGLGLALARKFVELHGGRIWVKSQPGLGSTFTFTIPLRRA